MLAPMKYLDLTNEKVKEIPVNPPPQPNHAIDLSRSKRERKGGVWMLEGKSLLEKFGMAALTSIR